MNGEIDGGGQHTFSDMFVGAEPIHRDVEFRDDLVPFEDHAHGNDHYALIHESPEEQLAVAVPFLREGIERGERCICVVDQTTNEREVMTNALRDAGVDIDRAMAVGFLEFYSVSDTYLRTEPFDPEAMVAFYRDVVETVGDEYEGFRVSAGTEWLDRIDVDAFMEYEGRVNKLFQATEAKALCHYDRSRLSPEVIRDVIRSHPHLIFEDTMCRNVYYIPPDELTGPDQPEREVERMMTTLKERQEARAELESSHARLEEFASAVSHDLKAPLSTVASYLQLLERRYEDELDDDAEEFIGFAVDGATRMREMVDGLVSTYAQLGPEGAPFEPVDLGHLVEEVLLDLESKVEDTDAAITVETLPVVRGDRGQLRQVLLNLIDNAIKYSGDEPPRVHVSAERDGDQWILSVSDEGIGIDEPNRDRIFDVFTRVHDEEAYPGTGVGLALCDRIVERHGGDIWVDSEPGVGSTFSFTLPGTNRD